MLFQVHPYKSIAFFSFSYLSLITSISERVYFHSYLSLPIFVRFSHIYDNSVFKLQTTLFENGARMYLCLLRLSQSQQISFWKLFSLLFLPKINLSLSLALAPAPDDNDRGDRIRKHPFSQPTLQVNMMQHSTKKEEPKNRWGSIGGSKSNDESSLLCTNWSMIWSARRISSALVEIKCAIFTVQITVDETKNSAEPLRWCVGVDDVASSYGCAQIRDFVGVAEPRDDRAFFINGSSGGHRHRHTVKAV